MTGLRRAARRTAVVLCCFVLAPCCGGAVVDTWTDVPSTVKSLQRALSTSFSDRTALLLGTVDGVVGGTGSANAPLVYISCMDPAADCFPPEHFGEYVAVVEEEQLSAVLKLIEPTVGGFGSLVSNIPQGIIALPGPLDRPFSPGPQIPLSSYQPSNSINSKPPWNSKGEDLIDLALPCSVFLAPLDLAEQYRGQAQQNIVRGFQGPTYGAAIVLETQMNLRSNSNECIAAKQCLPLGGYSVWAAMPPFNTTQQQGAPAEREQIVVLSHWDSRSLFRYMATGTHSALSGLVAMLVAVDILSRNGRGWNYSHDLIFMSLSGEAYDLLGSRRLLYDMQAPGSPHSASVDGLDAQSFLAVVELGMLGCTQGVFNDTPGPGTPVVPLGKNGSSIVLHGAGNTSNIESVFQDAADFAGSPQVSVSSQPDLPPSSLLAWRAVLNDTDAVYVGDFDSVFKEESFWSYKDRGQREWSMHAVARSAIVVARALHTLASDAPLDHSDINLKAAEDLTEDLFACLAIRNGLQCELVQSMTATHTHSSVARNTAEQYVGVLRELPQDDQRRDASSKKNIERFVWEFLANRTYTGAPQNATDSDGNPVGCDNTVNRCRAGQVCLHVSGGGRNQGECVNADVKYTPAYSTRLEYKRCTKDDDSDCRPAWAFTDPQGAGIDPEQWAARHSLPRDPVWTETFNEVVTVTINMRETELYDVVLLVCGLLSTALVAGVVGGIKALHKKQD